MRVEAGAVVDEFDLPGIGQVVARHTRIRTADADTWACMFTVVASGNAELAVVHRLSAPTLAEARRSVRNAVEFLAGRPVANTALDRRRGDVLGVAPVKVFPSQADRSPADPLPAPLS
jgi:hypothetical protein